MWNLLQVKYHGLQVMSLQNYRNVDGIFSFLGTCKSIFLYLNTGEVSRCC